MSIFGRKKYVDPLSEPLKLSEFKSPGQKAAVVKGRIDGLKTRAKEIKAKPVKRDIIFKQDLSSKGRERQVTEINQRVADLSKTLGRIGTDKTDAKKRARSAAIAKVREKQKVESKNKNFVSRGNKK